MEQTTKPAPARGFFPHWHGKEPIRAELFGLEHLEAHARELADCVLAARSSSGSQLLERFDENCTALVEAHRVIAEACRNQESFGSDAEWLLDNFHIISDSLTEVKNDMPRGYYRQLPKLAAGPLAGFPRVYALSLELICHCDSSLDETNITRFVQAYQAAAPLRVGELWAVPIMLRMVLLENLRRLAEKIVEWRSDRHEAKGWAAHVGSLYQPGAAPSAQPPAQTGLRPQSSWSDSLVVHLLENLQEIGAEHGGAVEWLERILVGQGTTTTEVRRREQQRQAANQVSIGNCVTSLRLLSSLDWAGFFERTSHLESLLREDPAKVYALQDFHTRDRYRRRVERLARGSRFDELEIGRRALALAREATVQARPDDRSTREPGPFQSALPARHIGYYLIDKGAAALEKAIRFRPSWRERLHAFILGNPKTVYFGGLLFLVSSILLGIEATVRWCAPDAGLAATILIAAAVLLPASELAIAVINQLICWVLPPRVLPRLDLKNGVPAEYATFVVVPSMLVRLESGSRLTDRLELHYLSNPDPQLRFALLTDFADASAESLPDDEAFLRSATASIKALNDRYCKGGPDRFFLFHRPRKWNPVQGCWMGFERKRGKLVEFNRWLRGAREDSFGIIVGDTSNLPPIRYVITLDADTQLPHETAQRLIAIISHPLNQPVFDAQQGRVVSGYGVLQPRIGLSLTSAQKSLFARVFTGSAGIDPYTTAVSDTYQDLFGLGSFTGKGIYDVDAFEAAVDGAFPNNRILSHDLIEGNYARCGLVTDVELFDEFPALYPAYAWREHRWARGDWQILAWLFPKVPRADGTMRRNTLPAVERWKIFDNLRRSSLPPSLVLFLFLGWTVFPGPAWAWTAGSFLILGWPLIAQLTNAAAGLLRRQKGRRRLGIPAGLQATIGQVLLSTVFLAEQSVLLLDAVARTLVRLFVTRRKLLEWETAASAERRLKGGLLSFVRGMWPAMAVALVLGSIVYISQPNSLPAATPILTAWFLSPLVAFWVSRPLYVKDIVLTEQERRRLRVLARKTWGFFECFVTEQDHWLPPDNFQGNRKEQVAHRTSPTNMGLYLLSCLAAHDFGFLSLRGLADRLEQTFDTFGRLDRWHGHFFNWYDTLTLQSLQPGYISTVDSGNLLACFIVLKQGLLEKAREGTSGPSLRVGLFDTLEPLTAELRALEAPGNPATMEIKQQVENQLRAVHALLDQQPAAPPALGKWLEELDQQAEQLLELIHNLRTEINETPLALEWWGNAFARLVKECRAELQEGGHENETGLRDRVARLASQAEKLAADMDFKLLYNDHRHLFATGYNLSASRLDNAHYDLLASEACLTSFLAVARGDAPTRHWFQLGRPLTQVGGDVSLLSWGGTMFEYLMPRLILWRFPNTLLDRSQAAAVIRQAEYGRQTRLPWGVSESAYCTVDAEMNYQYQAFGVPGLGFKRGLTKDLVVAPYATFLALTVFPRLAGKNLDRLAEEGAEGAFGYFEAIDYTRSRVPPKQRSVIVKCYMAHHQGMSFLALLNCLQGNGIARRFHAEPMVRATELLLQERVPAGIPLVQPNTDEMAVPHAVQEGPHVMSRRLSTPHTPHPRTHLLSSGQYNVMVTNSGGGYSTSRGLDVTRWREDRTCDHWGQFCYLRDLDTGAVWSATYQPLGQEAEEYEVTFSTDKAEFRRVDKLIETRLEIAVSPENHAEIRRLTLSNHDSRSHRIEVTSYAEIVLGSRGADLAHPAFAKLFLETEFDASEKCLLCRRRPRTPEEKPIWAVHATALDGPEVGALQYETDRSRFLGRGRTPARPAALDPGTALSGTTGPVLDPIFSLRRTLRLEPESSASIAFTTAVVDSRAEALTLVDHYRDFHGVMRAFELAWAHSHVELRHSHIAAEQAHLYQRLAAHVIYAGPNLRAPADLLSANTQGQSGLWRLGISGDNPIVLVRIAEAEELFLARETLAAHNYWRLKGLEADLVFLNEHETGYFEDLHQQLQALVRASDDRNMMDKPGGVFVRKSGQVSAEDRVLLQAAARCVLAGKKGSLAAQLDRLERPVLPVKSVARPASRPDQERSRNGNPIAKTDVKTPDNLQFFNGLGGFTPDGQEYLIRLMGGSTGQDARRAANPFSTLRPSGFPLLPPAPWINVIANRYAGFLVSETGAGFTWTGNSQMNRLTPWNNDPVSDSPGEIIYLRDEADGEVWTVTAAPVSASTTGCLVHHGQGYTLFERTDHALRQELLLFMPTQDPIKVMRLKLRNLDRMPRRLSATFYVEWVLGSTRSKASMYTVTELDPESGALLARNAFSPGKPSQVAFVDASPRPRGWLGDRTAFIGRNGSLSAPAALARPELANVLGAGLDPCGAVQVAVELKAGEEKELVFFLGETDDVQGMRQLLASYKQPGRVQESFEEVQRSWSQLLETIQVKTPNAALDLLLNRWLLYQVLGCRVWARSAFYQSSGAFGFRDQLQDVMALVYAAPQEAKAQILLAASRQFVEGDVQHWWHPPAGAGVRTRISDDYLWLAFVTCHYVNVTGDLAILDEQISFLQAPALRPDQDEDYRIPEVSQEKASLYEHCVRALERGFGVGQHGLPLMGTGDWNDGMNLVGKAGKGESVWVGWFLAASLRDFADLAERHGDAERAGRYRDKIKELHQAIEANAWDGKWYRRAYFDDGTPLGAAENEECRIDSITQSWAVISGGPDLQHARQAMSSVEEFLVRRDDKLILLFTPPFNAGKVEPGYVKGYVPGIRENGGQYTHAAAWVVQAFALLGRGERAMQLFDLVNPIKHGSTPQEVQLYRVEPYVAAGDVYAEPPHAGRGGWTWYTGSAGWLYRAALEAILGFRLSGSKLSIVPCIPKGWPGYEMTYRYKSTTYLITVDNPSHVENKVAQVSVDDQPIVGPIDLTDDGQTHKVRVTMG